MVLSKDKARELYQQGRDILDTAKKEKRDLTEAEQKTTDAIIATLDIRTEQLNDPNLLPVGGLLRDGPTIPPFSAFSRHVRTADGDMLELRKFNESLRANGVPNDEFRELNLGRVVRAMNGDLGACRDIERRALSSLTDAQGGFACPESVASQILDYARNKSRVLQAGAMTFEMTAGKHRVPTLDGDVTMTWTTEGGDSTKSATSLGAVEFEARTLRAWLPITRECLEDSIGLDAALRESIAQGAANAIDAAALVGSGDGATPRGLSATPGVTQTATTNALFDDCADAMTRIADANFQANGVIMSPKVLGKLRKLKDGEGRYMLGSLATPTWLPPIYDTKNVPDNVGTGSNKSLVFVGQWDRLWIGMRTQLRLEILREVYAKYNSIVLAAVLRCDIAAVRPAAFQIISEVPTR